LDVLIYRDATYVAVLTTILTEALTSPVFDLQSLYENGIALAALEETIGCREPRAACRRGYQSALRNAALQSARMKIRDRSTTSGEKEEVLVSGMKYSDRVKELERMLGMMLRLPEVRTDRHIRTLIKNAWD
jgi:hypothetical protein